MASARVYVGGELVALIDGNPDNIRQDAQRLANTWPKETTVLQIDKAREVVKPRSGAIRVIYSQMYGDQMTRKPHTEAKPISRRAHS